jgi:hypothetical protein
VTQQYVQVGQQIALKLQNAPGQILIGDTITNEKHTHLKQQTPPTLASAIHIKLAPILEVWSQ